MPEVITGVAAFGTLLMGVGTMAAWRQAKGVRKEVTTNHGKRAGEYIEIIHADVRELRDLVITHITDRDAHS